MPRKKYAADLHKIEGVEVFSIGNWNGDGITSQDLDDMVAAFDETSQTFRPALKLGHTEDQKLIQGDGLPAAGWVGRLYRMGDKLVADFIDIPKQIYELIKNKAYRNVSSEVYWNIDTGEKTYRRMLAAVALLGADVPAVMNLRDILARYGMRFNPLGERKCYAMELEGLKIRTYTHDTSEEDEPMPEDNQKVEKLEGEVKTYKAKVDEFSKENAELKAYKEKAEAERVATEIKNRDTLIESQVSELVTSKVATPAMKPYIKALLGEEKKVYKMTVGDSEKELSKYQMLSEVLKLSAAVKDINKTEESVDGDPIVQADGDDEKIQKYMKENKVNYSQAYREVMRGRAEAKK